MHDGKSKNSWYPPPQILSENTEKASTTQKPFITKELSRKMMERSRLRNNFLQKKTEDTRKLYVKQRNKCYKS